MTSNPKNRDTRIDFGLLSKRLPQSPLALISHSIGEQTPGRLPNQNENHSLTARKRSPDNIRTSQPISVMRHSPWDTYKALYQLQLGDSEPTIVAEERTISPKSRFSPAVIRHMSGLDEIQRIQQIRHENFVTVLAIFDHEGSYTVAFEYMPLSLLEVAGNPLLKELQLASIVGQILHGLLYLAKDNLEHGQLTCSNVLIDLEGCIKLQAQECCHVRSGRSQDIHALSLVVMELMHGYPKKGNVGIDNLERWPYDSLAVSFLSATDGASRMDQLLEHTLLQLPWHQSALKGLFSLAISWARRGVTYPA
ncbi:kinase-like domain-containing protein [Hypoxylon rubiginosum]|uniref:Kinase-like domain-containing protein n=1 Tax=Hypoxylon rubiginosum TaxID=110542 RepID=A0ACC0CIB6_9PEZI|nr:kinase-like domain-containing protein [Hypoxylon rubiginosum]